ncbi:MAG: pitrilysin family protein [Gammaproteobacteria bacterium]|nr:pitrilysin family protein [Gammaproteobacteria bacterium]
MPSKSTHKNNRLTSMAILTPLRRLTEDKIIKPSITFTALLFCMALVSTTAGANPDIAHWTTQNGARVYFVPAPELPIVDLRIIFDAGAARDETDPGLAVMTNGLMAEGAGGLSADQLAEQFESIGAQFSNSAQRDMAILSLRTLSEKAVFDAAVKTLTTILTQPDFPQDAFERERSRLLTTLKRHQQMPDTQADEAFYNALYTGHPYRTPPTGTEASISALNTAKLRAYYEKYYVARNAVLAIVGDLSRAEAEALAETVIGRLPAGQPAAELPPVAPLAEAQEIRINHPSAQTHILVGQPGLKRGDPDYFALYVGNHMLGGSGLVARLSNEIREKRGLAYSSYSYFLPMRELGPYTVGLQTKNESAEEALTVLRETIATFVQQGPSAEELDASKKNITGGFPLRIASNKNIIDYIGMIGFYQLPLDYLDTFNQQVQAVTVDDIKRAFQQRIQPQRMVTVMVGGKVTDDKN